MKMRRIWLKRLLIMTVLLSFVPLMRVSAEEDDSSVLAAMIYQPYQVHIGAENFPDSNFREFLTQYDADENQFLDIYERESVEWIYGNNKNFASLKGIEYFPGLLELNCNSNQLTELDLRANFKLNCVDCSRNRLTQLRLTGKPALRELYMQYNQLESVDINGLKHVIAALWYGNMGETFDNNVESYYYGSGVIEFDRVTNLIYSEGKWIKDDYGWWFADSTGYYPRDEWRNLPLGSGRAWYAFDARGYMRTGWFDDFGDWYYLSKETGINLGRRLTGWQKIDGQWYYLASTGIMRTGWQKIDGAWYFFDSYGKMQIGWKWDQGHWYYLKAKNGADLGRMQTGWQKIDSAWYYFEKKGTSTHPQGSMYAGEKTPDGFTVNASGVWVQ